MSVISQQRRNKNLGKLKHLLDCPFRIRQDYVMYQFVILIKIYKMGRFLIYLGFFVKYLLITKTLGIVAIIKTKLGFFKILIKFWSNLVSTDSKKPILLG